jgi:hypothetical protein
VKAWRIRYTIQDNYDTLDRVAYLESDTPPAAQQRLKQILEEQRIEDNDPMAHYDDINWVYDHDGNRIEIMDCEQVPTQRLIRVWHEAGGVYVGDRDCIVRRFPVSDDGYCIMCDLAALLNSLGYVVSLHTGSRQLDQRWVD